MQTLNKGAAELPRKCQMMVRNLPQSKISAQEGFPKPVEVVHQLSDKNTESLAQSQSKTISMLKGFHVWDHSSGNHTSQLGQSKVLEHKVHKQTSLYPPTGKASPSTSNILNQAAKMLKQSKSGITKIEAKSPASLKAALDGNGNQRTNPRLLSGLRPPVAGSMHAGKAVRDQRPSKNSITSDLTPSEGWKTVDGFDGAQITQRQGSNSQIAATQDIEPKDIVLPVMEANKIGFQTRATRSSLQKHSKPDPRKVPEKKKLTSKQSEMLRSASVKSLTNLKEITRYFMLPKSSAGWNREAKMESVMTERRVNSPGSHTLQDQSAATYVEDEQNQSRPLHQPKHERNPQKQSSKLIGSSSWAKLLRNSSDSPLHAAFKNMMQKLDKTRNSPDPGLPSETRRATGRASLLAGEASCIHAGSEIPQVSPKLEQSPQQVRNTKKMNVLDIIESTIQRLMNRNSHPHIPKSSRSQSIQENAHKKLEDKLGLKLAKTGQIRQSNDPNYAGYNFLYSNRLDASKGSRRPEKKESLESKNSQPLLYKESSRQSAAAETSKQSPKIAPATNSSKGYVGNATPIQALIGRLTGYTQNNLSTGRLNSLAGKGMRNGSASKSIFNAVSARESMQKPVLSLTSRAPRQSSTKGSLPLQLQSGKAGDNKKSSQKVQNHESLLQSPKTDWNHPADIKKNQMKHSTPEASAQDVSRPAVSDLNKKFIKKKLGLMIPETSDHLVSESGAAGGEEFQAQIEAGLCPKPLSTCRAQPHVSLSILDPEADSQVDEVVTLKPFSELLRNKPNGAADKFRGLNVSLGDSLVPHPETKIKNHKKFEFSGATNKNSQASPHEPQEVKPALGLALDQVTP